MRRLQTTPPYEAYVSIAESRAGRIGDEDFISLLVPALAEVEDDTIEVILPQWLFMSSKAQLDAINVAIIREYVKRVFHTEREEWEAKRRIAELKLKLQNDPSYTGIAPDPTQIAQDDLYATYTVQQFQDEIDFLYKRSLEAQLNGDHDISAMLSMQASNLTLRMKKLIYQQTYLQTKYPWSTS